MIPAPVETGGEWWTATGHDRAVAEHAAREGRSGDAGDQETYLFLPGRLPAELADYLTSR